MMVNNMKWAVTLLCCVNFASAAELALGRSVFLLPMKRGLDQFVANRLTRMHVLQVVTDPAKADIILTDQVGASFEDRMHELYPPPPAPLEAKEAAPKSSDTAGTSEQHGLGSIFGDTGKKPETAGSVALGGRGRGTVFLVDRQTRQVLWSAFEVPKSSNPHELDRTAERIVKRLKEDLTPKTK